MAGDPAHAATVAALHAQLVGAVKTGLIKPVSTTMSNTATSRVPSHDVLALRSTPVQGGVISPVQGPVRPDATVATTVAATVAASDAAVPLTPLTVFEANSNGFPCMRIPSALALPNNTLLVFAECRRWAGDGCFVKGWPNASRQVESLRSICQRRSVDGGATFGALFPNITNHYSANPSAVWDHARERVLLTFDDTKNGGLYSMASHDLGLTWDEPSQLVDTDGTKLAGVAGPGNSIVVTSNGDLLLAVYHADRAWTDMFSFANVLRSQDGGASWVDMSPLAPAGSRAARMFAHLGEPSLAVLSSGQLVLDSRCPDGRKPYPGPAAPCNCDCRGVSVSNDGGTSWSQTTFDASVADPDSQGAVLGLANGSIAFSNPNCRSGTRRNQAVRVGSLADSNATVVEWADSYVRVGATPETPGGYSSIFQFQGNDGRIGVLWETEGEGQHARGCHGICSIVLSFV